VTKQLKIGVAGAGVFGGHHASKIAAHPQAVLAGVYDLDAERAAALAHRFGAVPHHDYARFLCGLDAVAVAASASAHYELARAALEAGRHVFVEKPIALDMAQANGLVALARQRGLVLQVGHQERYVASAAGLLDRKDSPLKVDCVRRTAASGRCEDVSVVLDLMIHDIDIIRQLTNSDIASVTAQGSVHDASAELTLRNGAIVSILASRRAATPERRMTLVYADGIIEFDFINRTLLNTTQSALNAEFDPDAAPLAFRDPLAYGADRFIAAIAGDAAPAVTGPIVTGPIVTGPIVTGEDGRDALDWAVRIENAAAIGGCADSLAAERMRA
jgi:predicted dehydrogenase